jgi:trans-2,3-dihydro-3-hydroxyanthranilate isomerase
LQARQAGVGVRSGPLGTLAGAYPYTVLDVFTDRRLAGNALAVVHDADGVPDATMGAFARETRLAETTFVQTATDDGADYRNRIWTVAGELPFAGHPSLGTAVAVAAARGDSKTSYVQQTGAGLQPVDAQRNGEVWNASMLQEPATFGTEVEPHHVMAAVGLVPADAHRELRPQTVSTGLPTLVAPVRAEAAIASAAPDFALVETLLETCEAVNLYLAWHDGQGGARARMFTQLVEGREDPATGSAAGPLCAYLHRHGVTSHVRISQGVEIGRPSTLVAAIDGDRVRVSGDVVVVIRGQVFL